MKKIYVSLCFGLLFFVASSYSITSRVIVAVLDNPSTDEQSLDIAFFAALSALQFKDTAVICSKAMRDKIQKYATRVSLLYTAVERVEDFPSGASKNEMINVANRLYAIGQTASTAKISQNPWEETYAFATKNILRFNPGYWANVEVGEFGLFAPQEWFTKKIIDESKINGSFQNIIRVISDILPSIEQLPKDSVWHIILVGTYSGKGLGVIPIEALSVRLLEDRLQHFFASASIFAFDNSVALVPAKRAQQEIILNQALMLGEAELSADVKIWPTHQIKENTIKISAPLNSAWFELVSGKLVYRFPFGLQVKKTEDYPIVSLGLRDIKASLQDDIINDMRSCAHSIGLFTELIK